MKYSETETTEINQFSETEGTGIKTNNWKYSYLLMIFLSVFISTNAMSNELNLFSQKSSNNLSLGILKINNQNYFVEGIINETIFTGVIYKYESIKSVEDGTGDSEDVNSVEDGTGDSGEVYSVEDGTGDSDDVNSVEDGTGNPIDEFSDNSISLNNHVISLIIQCGTSEGVIENSNGELVEIFEGFVTINGNNVKCSE
jgi:uncharacterized integral membrane protein